MKMKESLEIIGEKHGYAISFEEIDGIFLRSNHFPEVMNGETPIPTEASAWAIAKAFANNTRGKYVNIYVIHSNNKKPVDGYESKKISNRKNKNEKKSHVLPYVVFAYPASHFKRSPNKRRGNKRRRP